ncbi:MAG: hypothetical protein DLM55_07840 [Acidimicrobiales bacterium]|nr:MAG: hypothetical protein DLM55_07840 [Acidimicrobiales bacterium]
MLMVMQGAANRARWRMPARWLLAVVVLLAGLLLAHGVQCTDGMTMHLPTAHDSHVSQTMAPMGTDTVNMLDHVAPAAAGLVVAAVDNSIPSPMTPGMLLGTCLAMLAAVVFTLAITLGRAPTWLLHPVATGVRRHIAPLLPAPSLAQLCVLRT